MPPASGPRPLPAPARLPAGPLRPAPLSRACPCPPCRGPQRVLPPPPTCTVPRGAVLCCVVPTPSSKRMRHGPQVPHRAHAHTACSPLPPSPAVRHTPQGRPPALRPLRPTALALPYSLPPWPFHLARSSLPMHTHAHHYASSSKRLHFFTPHHAVSGPAPPPRPCSLTASREPQARGDPRCQH